MPPSTRANITVDDDAPAAGAAEQVASLQMLNLDTAVNVAVERTFEQHRSEMVAQLLAALDSRDSHAVRRDAAPPAAEQGSNAIGCNQLQSLQSTSSGGPVGTSGENGDSGQLENSLSDATRRSRGRARGDEPWDDPGADGSAEQSGAMGSPDDNSAPDMEVGAAVVAKLITT